MRGVPQAARAEPTIGQVLLFLFGWPFFVLYWWANPDARPQWVRELIKLVRTYPKLSAGIGIAVGLCLLIGGLVNNASENFPASIAGAVVMAACAGLLRWQVARERAAAAAEVAARADAQHAAYMRGEHFGVYGTNDLPEL
ncbi:hypothetical protein [Nocardia gipuzkoensis]|uniref:hypothetical protein n=1 Tax=Nocardia gipuzkoensis TaxID=2749991 RepID=UPI00237E19CB|nr:hypothetical protein [Nocardia gipuzkoensis]MDE1672019.1 hypothetical protein [Nocardia gipuzkoensis]